MKQRRHGLDGLGQAKGLHTLEEVLARASELVQRGLRPRELQVTGMPTAASRSRLRNQRMLTQMADAVGWRNESL